MSDNTNPEGIQTYTKNLLRLQENRVCDQNQKKLARSEYVYAIKQQFPIGSVVQLKSGGPKMTVHYFTEDDDGNLIIHTVFYLDNRDFIEQKFSPEIIKLVPDKKEEVDTEKLHYRYVQALQRAMEHTKATT